MCRKIEITVTENTGTRLDAYLTEEVSEWTRSFVKGLIVRGCVLVNKSTAKAGLKVRSGDEIVVCVPETASVDVVPQDIPLPVVYEDADVAVVNKPQGMVTHPAAGNPDQTLVNALLFHIHDLAGIGGELRPGIVHRLDKDTSGLMMVAKNDTAHENLSAQIADRKVEKVYIALVHGNMKKDSGIVCAPIGRDPRDRKKMAVVRHGGREAVTHYRVLKRYGAYTLVEVTLETGRTHQIRVHMKYIGHPVAGDQTYTRQKDGMGLNGQLLHAARLGFFHPRTGEWKTFYAPLPDYFEAVLKSLTEI